MAVAAQALLFAAAWCGASSFLLQTGRGAQPRPEDRVEKRANRTFQMSVLLPSVAEYRRIWTARLESDRRRSEPMPESIKMVMGVFTIPQERDYRQVVRETWLDQAGVCSLEGGPSKDCSVYAAFVMCSEGWGVTRTDKGSTDMPAPEGFAPEDMEAAHREPGAFVLKGTMENMNGPKTMRWFQAVLLKFGWATHIAKMDMDTFPFMHKLVNRMAGGPSCGGGAAGPYEYVGWPTHCGHCGTFEGAYCPPSTGDQFAVGPEREWDHMGGQLYALTRPLAALIPWPAIPHNAGEDRQVAMAIGNATIKHGICVTPRALDSWYHGLVSGAPDVHGEAESSPDYANEP